MNDDLSWLTAEAMEEERVWTVTEFAERCNRMLEEVFASVIVEGEVASLKIYQGKWVFFDLKEGDTSVSCFMGRSVLGRGIEDGMKVRIRGVPKLTNKGKFSLTVWRIMPVGEGNIKKAFELLKRKLAAEGLFDPARKRPIPDNLTKIGVISSTMAAGYIDFLKILGNRWGGMKIQTINTQVQGLVAAEQVTRAVQHFNAHTDVQVIVILRGGGSAEDLATFNDEILARTIAASKIPVVTGIGHEIDESLADLAADLRASTPSNAAERLSPDRKAVIREVESGLASARRTLMDQIERLMIENETRLAEARRVVSGCLEDLEAKVETKLTEAMKELRRRLEEALQHLAATSKILDTLNPENVLERGYAILAKRPPDGFRPGDETEMITMKQILTVEVKNATERKEEND